MEGKKQLGSSTCGRVPSWSACAYPYNKDRPYDPNFTSEQLIDQIPNWEGEALRKRACGTPKAERYSWMRDIDCGD